MEDVRAIIKKWNDEFPYYELKKCANFNCIAYVTKEKLSSKFQRVLKKTFLVYNDRILMTKNESDLLDLEEYIKILKENSI